MRLYEWECNVFKENQYRISHIWILHTKVKRRRINKYRYAYLIYEFKRILLVLKTM